MGDLNLEETSDIVGDHSTSQPSVESITTVGELANNDPIITRDPSDVDADAVVRAADYAIDMKVPCKKVAKNASCASRDVHAPSIAHERRFFCREWAWAKLWACVEQRPSAKTCGVLIVGGPGTGKTALCTQLVSPTGVHGRHATSLQSRILAHHFCHAHEATSLSVASFIQCLVVQLAESSLIRGYSTKVVLEDVVQSLDLVALQKQPDEAFRRAVIFPLLELDPPDKTLLLLVDSVDEDSLLTFGGCNPSQRDPSILALSATGETCSKSILELLANHYHLLPQWLLLVITARRGSYPRSVSRTFSGFRRIVLDDLRRSHVVRDVQQYILCRLDNEPALRHHLSRETAEMLNQLHIKSNGCFLYLEKVLDGVVEGWVTLREIRDIPGTLNGLYLWLCQRLYPRKHFQRVLPLLAVVLASRAPLTLTDVREAIATHIAEMTEEEWAKRWALLKRVLCPYTHDIVLLFHHSFAEWLLDVKHCTQKYLVQSSLGHSLLAMKSTLKASSLTPSEVQDFAFHLARIPIKAPLEAFHMPLWLLSSGAPIHTCFDQVVLKDHLSQRILQDAGAHLPEEENLPEEEEDEEEEDYEEEEEEEELENKTKVKYEELKEEEIIKEDIIIKELEINTSNSTKEEEEEKTEKTNEVMEESTQTEKQNLRDVYQIATETSTDNRIEDSVDGLVLSRKHSGEGIMQMEEFLNNQSQRLEKSEDVKNLKCFDGSSNHRSGSEGRRSREGRRSKNSHRGSRESTECSSNSSRQRERRRRKHREDPLYPYLRGGPINGVDAAGRTLLHTAAHQGDASLVNVLLERGAAHSLADRGGQTPLNLAARHGHADVVASLLVYGANPDHADDDGWTSLRSAAWAGHVNVVDALLKGGAQADLADGDGRTALRAAAWGGHDDVVSTLLKHGADVNRADSEGRTPLIAAAYMGHYEIVTSLILGGADVNHSDKDGRSALSVGALCVSSLVGDLCLPANEGRLQVVTALLEGGADVDHQDKDGLTPLLVAAFEGHEDVCELLLEYDGDVDHVDRSGRTPLLAAASMGHASVVERLLFWGCYVDHIDVEGRTVLSVAAAQGSQETVRLLLDRGLDETHRDNAGWTPLHYAAFEGHREVCELLIAAGARINEVDNDGKHALVLTAQEGHASVVASLLDAGASLHHTSHDGRSALRVAGLEGHKDVVHLLLCRGADLHYKDADGRSTLYLLALEDRLEMAAFLLESGADVESTDLEGRTPLHVTSWQGHAQMVELLLSHGARVDAEDLERRTPLQSAAWQGNTDIVRILLEHGADANHSCSQGATALSIAAQEGHEECVALLLQFGANPAHSDRCGRTAIKVALKGGHHRLARMLEDHLEQQKGHGNKMTPLSMSSLASGSTTETKPCSALLCPGLTSSPVESPESTFEKRRSCLSLGQSSSKSSCNLSTSTRSSSGGLRLMNPRGDISSYQFSQHQQTPAPPIPPIPSAPPASVMSPVLSFTQQLQQCGRVRGRKHPPLPQPALTPLDEPASPIYASPPISPVNDIPPPLPQRMNPVVALLEEEYSLPVHGAPKRPLPSAPPAVLTPEQISRHIGLSQGSAVGIGGPLYPPNAPPQIPQNPNSNVGIGMGSPSSGFTFTQDQHMRIILGSRSPESRPKRNGIVTNPSLKAAQAKAAHILRNGLPGRPRHNPSRPNGLNIKKETPL